jgi:hypothetical protein
VATLRWVLQCRSETHRQRTGAPDDDYDVIAFDGGDGRRVFMRFRGSRAV